MPIKPTPKRSIMAGSGIGASDWTGVARLTDETPINRQDAASPMKSIFFIILPLFH